MTVAATGPAAPEDVWDRYRYPARWPEWAPQIRSVDYPDQQISSGVRGTVRGPLGFGVEFEILDVDEVQRTWSWRVIVVGITLTLQHAVGADKRGTRTELSIDGSAPIVLGYIPIARIALGRLVR